MTFCMQTLPRSLRLPKPRRGKVAHPYQFNLTLSLEERKELVAITGASGASEVVRGLIHAEFVRRASTKSSRA